MLPDSRIYLGDIKKSYIGYATNDIVAANAASGGFVTAFLSYLLEFGIADAAYVCRLNIVDGRLQAQSFVARTVSELLESQTSIYCDLPYFESLRDKMGASERVVFVGLPCQIHALNRMADRDPDLRRKIVLKVALYCSHATSPDLIHRLALLRHRVDMGDVQKMYFRKGHWRGNLQYHLKDGSVKQIPYLKAYGLYMNLYLFMRQRCFSCSDHTCTVSDISCGDAWLKRLKVADHKYSMINVRTDVAVKLFEEFAASGRFMAEAIDSGDVLRSQRRGLIRKIHYVYPYKVLARLFGFTSGYRGPNYAKWNHWIGAFFLMSNVWISSHRMAINIVLRLPRSVLYAYVAFIKALMNF